MADGRARRGTGLVAPGGLAVALLGFGLTRFVVAGTIGPETSIPFTVGVVPLVVGLVFTVYGVVLAVGDLPRAYVRTVVRWSFLGVSVMALVLAGTVLGSQSGTATPFAVVQDVQFLVSNVLLAGAVGGALTGDRAGLNRRNRNEIELQAELALIANGLLRHEVLNATAIIDGYTSLFDEQSPRESDIAAIRAATDRITATVADVGAVGRARENDPLGAVGICSVLCEEVDSLGDRYPDAEFAVSTPDADVSVLADRRIRLLVRKLLETVAERGAGTPVRADVGVERRDVSLSVSTTEGTAAPETTTADDPAAGFDRRIVELLAAYYSGDVEFGASEGSGSPAAVVLTIPRATGERATSGRIGIATPGIVAALSAGAIAGVTMGALFVALTGLLPVVGALYGVSNALVGWITHLFHSAVFALLFAAGYTHFYAGDPNDSAALGALAGAGWGVVLWIVAAGILMPVWLRAVGVASPLPNLTAVGLFTHVVWGAVLGSSYVLVRRRFEVLKPWLRFRAAFEARFREALGRSP